MTERIHDTTLGTTKHGTGSNIDTEYAEIVGESGVRGKGKESVVTEEVTGHKKGLMGDITAPRRDPDDLTLPRETTLHEGVTTHETTTTGPQKEGFLSKIKSAIGLDTTTTSTSHVAEEGFHHRGTHETLGTTTGLTTEERVLREKDFVVGAGETRARVLDEKDIDTHRTREKIIEERDIVAPVEHRRVVEQRHPMERIRVIEEVTKLKIAAVAAGDRRKIIDAREDRKPVQRRVIREEQIRVPVEKRKVIEEIWASESIVVFEEKAPIREGTIGPAVKTEVKSELKGAAMSAGKFSYKGTPTKSRVVDDYTVEGVVETRRQIEEIEVVEFRRIIEEREPLATPLLDEEIIKQHRAKKY